MLVQQHCFGNGKRFPEHVPQFANKYGDAAADQMILAKASAANRVDNGPAPNVRGASVYGCWPDGNECRRLWSR